MPSGEREREREREGEREREREREREGEGETETCVLFCRSCCEKAGFEVMRIISEPAAICLAHGVGQRNKTEKRYVHSSLSSTHTHTHTHTHTAMCWCTISEPTRSQYLSCWLLVACTLS